jgi:hypothetical protein
LIAASVWMTPSMGRFVTLWIVRPRALTIPVVSVWSRPKGLPIAKTFCPTCTSVLVPTLIGTRFCRGALILSTARSWSGATPTEVAS